MGKHRQLLIRRGLVFVPHSAVNGAWRCIISVGAFPALVAILLRRLLPETPRFLAEHASVTAAMRETGLVYNARTHPVPAQQEPRPQTQHDGDGHPGPDPGSSPAIGAGGSLSPGPIPAPTSTNPNSGPVGDLPPPTSPSHGTVPPSDDAPSSTHGSIVHSAHSSSSSTSNPRRDDFEMAPNRGIRASIMGYLAGLRTCLARNSRWRASWESLPLVTSWTSRSTVSAWTAPRRSRPCTSPRPPKSSPTTRADPSQPNITIYDMLIQNTQRNLQTITTGTLPGSILILLTTDYVPRATWMACTFVALAALFAVTGGTLFVAYESDKHAMTLVFYVLMQLLNNLGPNTMTWILPAELFATRYRATLYGWAAAAGKLGAITIQLINSLSVSSRSRMSFAGMLLGLSPAMLLGAFFSWVWVPEVQEARARVPEDAEPVMAGDISGPGSGDEDGAGDAHSLTPTPPPQHRTGRGGTETRAFLESLILRNRTLEDIAEDPARGQIIGIRPSVKNAYRKFLGKRREEGGGSREPASRD